MRSHPTLNQTGELKAAFCCRSRWASSSWKMAASSPELEVSALDAPVADGLGDARDELADAGFALGRVHRAVQVLAGHDVGGGHRPVFGGLDVLLLEDHAALGVGDLGEAEFPLDLVVGRDAGLGEIALERKSHCCLLLIRCCGGAGWRRHGGFVGNFRHWTAPE